MERCPNCGAPARPGAKFCTTCGYRLPVTAAPEPAESPASSWPAAPSAEPTSDEPAMASATSESTAGGDSTWPSNAASGEWTTTISATTTTPPAAETLPESAATPAPDALAEPVDADAPAPETPAISGLDRVTDDGTAERETTQEADSLIVEETVTAPAPASSFEGWSTGVFEEVAVPAASGDRSTPIARATALLDELRLLLPTLGGGEATSAETAPLREALTAGDARAEDRERLRRAFTDARDNPRDIQTLLAIAEQADAAIALLDDYDNLAQASRQVLSPASADSPGLYR